MSSETDRQLAQWAESGLTKPRRAVTGPQAGAEARAMLETAGVDVAAVERRVGRPRLDGSPPKPHGQRSPVSTSQSATRPTRRSSQRGSSSG